MCRFIHLSALACSCSVALQSVFDCLFLATRAASSLTTLSAAPCQCPAQHVLRSALLRIDLCGVIFQRSSSEKYVTFRYVLADSSPQLGFNFLCVREDSISIPTNIYADQILRAGYDLNKGYSTRVLKLAVLGHGRASGVKKMKQFERAHPKTFNSKHYKQACAFIHQNVEGLFNHFA